MRRDVAQPALHDALMERVLASENLRRAWRRVKSNQGAPGIDGMRIEDFPEFARSSLPAIRQALREGTYRPQPVRRVTIPKPDGGERLLGIPTVMDRIIQQAIAQVLGPLFDPGFSDSSFGFRPGRSAHGALRRVQAYIGEGYRIAVDLDLAKFLEAASYCPPIHGEGSNRSGVALITLMRRPFRLPRRRCTACSFPRFTHCNTV
jgi:RNA-directed DNA polymerase